MPHRLELQGRRHVQQQHRQQGQEAIGAKAPVKASSQKGSQSLGGSSGKATASTHITSSPLAVAAARPANRWRSPLGVR
ncbi:MAG: hypothetical protein ACKOPS_19155 [Cyanobium sp.]